jgi:mono/diheme cytochrome c family protein
LDLARKLTKLWNRTACAGVLTGLAFLVGALSSFGADAKGPATTQATADPNTQPMWINHIEPILAKNCFGCHGEKKKKGGLDLRLTQSIFAGGNDGSVVIVGRPNDSPLYQRILPNAKDHMPPEDGQLSVEEVSLVQQWIMTLPTASEGGTGTGVPAIFGRTAPSLMEQAKRFKWEAPAGMGSTEAIDFLIGKKWQEAKIAGSDFCDDGTFVRRIYLDLAGRIPTRSESDVFVKSNESQKRAMLVDRLLAGDEYPRHLAEVLDVALMERKGRVAEAERKARGWFAFLEKSIAANRAWNEVVADLITARPKSPEYKGAVAFLYEKKNNYQLMAEGISPVAFGVSVGCAQCHNDPLAHEIKQQNYWGLVAAFNRSTNADTNQGPGVSEAATGGFVFFVNLKKESQPAIITLLNEKTIDEKRPADGTKEEDSDANYIVKPSKDKKRPNIAAIPKFSRRQAIADAITHDNPLLARAFVNRMWAMLLGRGIVYPVDQMNSTHPPSHPELLAFLADDFAKSGYDVKRLIRVIVLSRTYQLDWRVKGATPPAKELFACALEKPLSAEVLYRSLLTASGDGVTGPARSTETDGLRQKLIATFPGMFEVEYNATLQQAMFLSNNPLLDGLLKPQGENLTARLEQISGSRQKASEAFLDLLGRLPDDEELAKAAAYLDARSERPEAAVKQLAWVLIASPEFLLNH